MRSRRALATVLFTDIVGSTERASELGDRAWRELLSRHHRIVREEIRRWGGEEVTEAGDGFLAVFASSARAIACAHTARERVRGIGLEIRCGLHMGQIERQADGSAGGIAVHIGSRTAAEARAGEIVVTSAIRDAETGSEFGFEDLGRRALKGIDREWRLFLVTAIPDDFEALAPGAWESLRSRVVSRPVVVAAVAVTAIGAFVAIRQGGADRALATEVRSVAVLPLENLTGDPDQEYFVEGMTEALITELSKMGELRVISRTSSNRFKGADRSLTEIAEALGVGGIVEGSVARDGDRVRITAQLIHAGTDSNLWAESYETELADILGVQSEIARAIAREIEIALTPAEESRLASARTVDPVAYEAYLRGNFSLNQMTPEGFERGLALLEEAVARDPRDPLPYAGLARGYSLLASHTPDPPPDAFDRAREAYRRALELDRDFAEAHAAVAERKLYLENDWEGAEAAFRLALELNPSLPGAHAHYAWYLNLFDRNDEALAEMRRAVEVDPLTPLWAAWLADIQSFAGDFEGAEGAARRAIEVDPDFAWSRASLSLALAGQGEYRGAIATLEPTPPNPYRELALGQFYVATGRETDARRVAAALAADPDPLDALSLVIVHAALGEHDDAARWLAFEPAHPWVPWLRTWPLLGGFREDPRFRERMERLGLPPAEPS
jgi:TolB-like protein/class 3 adenylate cyclase/Tfp pilus assembly protein PilF